ncbi:MAG: MMPL family transporter [Bacilli bacterium]|nr:MMPL family transporter [Bacilli bacterium]MBN2876288.1 MMPL family transporter [Bacilli bacterium]
MKKYTEFIFKNTKVLIAFAVVYTLFSLVGIFQLKLNTDFSLFSTNDNIYEERLQQMEGIYGETNETILLIETPIFTDSMVSNYRALQAYLESVDHVESVQGAFPATILIAGVSQDITNVSSDALLQYYDSLGDFSPHTLSLGSHYFTFTLITDSEFSRTQIKALESYFDQNDYTYYISGDIYNQSKIVDYILQILLILPPLTIITMLLVFRWQMKAIKATLFSVLPAVIGSVWTLGFIGWLGNEVSILTAIVPIFIIVIGSADGLHFMSHFQNSRMLGKNAKDAIIETLEIVGVPMIITTLTSIAGFLALLSMNTSSVQDLAIFSALGILLAGIATWYILPLILSHDVDVTPKRKERFHVDLSKPLKKVWGLPILVVVVVIAALAGLFYSKINNEFSMLMIYKDYTVVVKNAEKAEEINGGSIPLFVLVPLEEDATTLDSLNRVTAIETALNESGDVNKVINPYDMLQIIYNTQYAGDIPSDFVLSTIYNNVLVSNATTINNLISTDKQYVRLLVFSKDLENDTLDQIEQIVADTDNTASVTSVQYLIKDLNVSITSMQINSILLSLGLIFVMLLFSLRRFVIALLSVLPIIITIFALYAFLGISQIPLNITTVVIFSITIGVGIDYAVHYSSVYRYYLKKGNSNQDAIQLAYDNTSRPIIANALGISLGMSVLMLSPLTIHFNVSSLMWVSMIISVFMTLTFLPTVFGKLRQPRK